MSRPEDVGSFVSHVFKRVLDSTVHGTPWGHLGTDDVVWLGFEFLWLGNHIRQPAGVSVI